VGYLGEIALGACGSLLAAEVWAHADPLSRWLIRRAVLRIPEEQRARLEEEWLAHLEETPGAVRKLLHAIGCWSGAPAVGRAVAGRIQQRARMTSTKMFTMFTMRLRLPVARPHLITRAWGLGLLSGMISIAAAYALAGWLGRPIVAALVLVVFGGATGYMTSRLLHAFPRDR
jgi:hypothetical protein